MLSLEVVKYILRAFALGYLLGSAGWMTCLALVGLMYGTNLLSQEPRRKQLGEGLAFLINGAHRRLLSGRECQTLSDPDNNSNNPLSFLVPVTPPIRSELVDPQTTRLVVESAFHFWLKLSQMEEWLIEKGVKMSRLYDFYQELNQ